MCIIYIYIYIMYLIHLHKTYKSSNLTRSLWLSLRPLSIHHHFHVLHFLAWFWGLQGPGANVHLKDSLRSCQNFKVALEAACLHHEILVGRLTAFRSQCQAHRMWPKNKNRIARHASCCKLLVLSQLREQGACPTVPHASNAKNVCFASCSIWLNQSVQANHDKSTAI